MVVLPPEIMGLPEEVASSSKRNQRHRVYTTHPRKHAIRFVFRSLSLVALIGIYAILTYCFNNNTAVDEDLKFFLGDSSSASRHLAEAGCPAKLDAAWVAPYILFIIYMFLALAVVCDEFFVPALEEMSGPRQMNLDMDIAGATLMAAGGSAPELFTSFFGTFQQSELGFGTIVGSAVFNVLFVIGTCSLLSKEVLELTWWPLFRDSIYYVMGLSVLAIFVAVVSPNVIHIWEAAILFVLYIGYCVLMAYNQRLYKWILVLKNKGKNKNGNGGAGVELERQSSQRSVGSINSSVEVDVDALIDAQEQRAISSTNVLPSESGRRIELERGTDFRWPGTFRTGVVKLITKPHSWKDKAGAGLVASIKGDVHAVFSHVDEDGSDSIDKEELKKVLGELNISMTDEEFEQLYTDLDEDGNGHISKSEFEKWYTGSQERMAREVEKVFQQLDTDNDGTLTREEIAELLKTVSNPTAEEITAAINEMYQSGDLDRITYGEFVDWYSGSLVYQNEIHMVEEESEGIFASVKPPTGGSWWSWVSWLILLPIVITLAFTVPDVRRAGVHSRYCYLAFLFSIIWIGIYSYFMVEATTAVGNTFGIPDVIMGLTFLAAGTSVPDLLSSVIVARQGKGDMAVSSSIGSNIFDILVGLPLPWLIYQLWPTTDNFVKIGSDGIGISIGILVAMIALIILTIHLNGWKLTKCAGIMMFVFYAAFLVQAIWQELPFESC
mmetsp:Transcript_1546/g.2276  ORF Transcript_1546/g.2276 Transcript_1546/m.2276 type:complete len:723 (+) Transcript_1546:59-2227(+)